MDIKKLNETLGKFLSIDEVSDDLVGEVRDAREKAVRDASDSFRKGSGSLDNLKKAKSKFDKHVELSDKRDARQQANVKHTLCIIEPSGCIIKSIEDLANYTKDYKLELGGMTDDDVLRLWNNRELKPEYVITDVDDAFVNINQLEEDGENTFEVSITKGKVDFSKYVDNNIHIFRDMKPEEVKAAVDKIVAEKEDREKALADKANPKKLAKLIAKGRIEDLDTYEEDGKLKFSFCYEFKNPGFKDNAELRASIQSQGDFYYDLLDELLKINAPLPETKDLDAKVTLCDDAEDLWLRVVDNKTLCLGGVYAEEV